MWVDDDGGAGLERVGKAGGVGGIDDGSRTSWGWGERDGRRWREAHINGQRGSWWTF